MKTSIYRQLCAVLILLASIAAAQQATRLIDWQPVVPSPNANVRAIQVVGITVNATHVITGEPFSANDDWLDKLTFKIRNVSDKTITVFWFHVAFPEIDLGDGGHAGLGILYESDKSPDGRNRIAPGSEVAVTLAADKLHLLRQTSNRMIGTTHLTRLNILPGAAFFDDGSSVSGISLRRP